ncbi:unnamed protein product [Prorocentrum cordatum]|uniref:Uncharacterized protein n=1 Tax=Prorocentrum cordatum TaxID=2364126 RepID=A0ABN9RUM2_9DINO|nr:unnamed protein product [Polarella glacialis]
MPEALPELEGTLARLERLQRAWGDPLDDQSAFRRGLRAELRAQALARGELGGAPAATPRAAAASAAPRAATARTRGVSSHTCRCPAKADAATAAAVSAARPAATARARAARMYTRRERHLGRSECAQISSLTAPFYLMTAIGWITRRR